MPRNMNLAPTKAAAIDAWSMPVVAQSPDAWGGGTSTPGFTDDGWGSVSTASLEASWNMPAVTPAHEQQTNRESERLPRGLRARIGDLATRLSGILKGVDVAGTLRKGGRLEQGIDTASRVVDRADTVANGRAANMLSKAPVVGKYVEAARGIVGTAAAVSEMAGHYGQVAGAVEQSWSDRGAMAQAAAGYGKEAGKRIAMDGARAALEVVASQAGVSYERTDDGGNTLKVRKAKLARFAVKAAMTGGKSVVTTGGEAAKAGAMGARQSALNEAARAREMAMAGARQAYETGSTGWSAPVASELTPAASWDTPSTVSGDGW